MENNKYKIKYLPTFSNQLNSILYYFAYELKNKIVAENFYKEVMQKIEKRSISPASFEIFKKTKEEGVNWYRIQVKKFTIFYVVKGDTMEVRRTLYSRRIFDKLV